MESIQSFLSFVRRTIRARQMSLRTEDSYLSTIRRFIVFHGKRHPQNLTPDNVTCNALLSSLLRPLDAGLLRLGFQPVASPS